MMAKKKTTFLERCRAAQEALGDLLDNCGAVTIVVTFTDDFVTMSALPETGETLIGDGVETAQSGGARFEDAAYDLIYRAQGQEPLPF